MKIFRPLLIYTSLIMLLPFSSFGQLKIRVDNGAVRIDDGSLFFKPGKFRATADSLDKLLNSGKTDTTLLLERALIYDLSSNQLAKPVPGDKAAYDHLMKAEDLVKKAIELKMHSFTLKVLRAQICRDLTYRFIDDQSWKYIRENIVRRRSLFNNFKTLANKNYEELAQLDRANAGDYQKLLVKTNYPIAD